ncbi:MAG: alpha/beta fold hydrolase [Armatimonadota bacterium]
MPHATANGISLYYEVAGEGPAVALIGGLGSDGHFWYKQTPALKRHFRVITFDNRGAGRSTAPDAPYTLRMMADDLAGLLDALDVSAAHIVGASMGGFIAQEFALAYPDRVERLVLCCTSFGGPNSVPIPQETVQSFLQRTGDPERDLRAAFAYQLKTDYADTHARELDEYVAWRVAHPQGLSAYHRQLAAASAHDTEGRLASLRCPMLILHGIRDNVVPAGNADLLAAKIPGARVHVFADAGHLFLWERADDANRLIVEFLTAREPRFAATHRDATDAPNHRARRIHEEGS